MKAHDVPPAGGDDSTPMPASPGPCGCQLNYACGHDDVVMICRLFAEHDPRRRSSLQVVAFIFPVPQSPIDARASVRMIAAGSKGDVALRGAMFFVACVAAGAGKAAAAESPDGQQDNETIVVTGERMAR